jgi:localization factor PodJL
VLIRDGGLRAASGFFDPVMDESMKRAASWSIDGIKPDIREAAREAARRQGLTLSEWLNDIIAEHASELDIDADEMDSNDRLEAVAARLHQLGDRDDRQGRHQRPRGVPHDNRDDDPPRSARSASVYDDLEERRRMKRQDRNQDRNQDRVQDRSQDRYYQRSSHEPPRDALRLQDAEALLDAAIDAFDERATKSQRQTAQSVEAVTRLLKSHTRQRDESMEVLSDIANRLSDIETQITRQAVDEACGQGGRNSQLEALPIVARRLADIESHLAKRSPDEAYRPIKGALSRLESRLDSMTQKPAGPVRDEAGLKRLESKLDALLRSSALASPDNQGLKPLPKAGWRDSLEEAVAEIGQHQRALNGDAQDWRVAPRRAQNSPINVRLNKSSTAASASKAPDISLLQQEISALGVKLEAMRLQDLAKDLTRMRTDMGTMSAGLADLAPRDSVTAIESALRNLTARIEISREEGMRETLLKPLTELTEDLRHSLGGANAQASISELEREIKTLSEKLETIGKISREPSAFPDAIERLQEQMQDIHNLLKTAAVNPQSIGQIEKKIAALSEQVDRQRNLSQPSLGPSEDDFVSPRFHQAQIESFLKIEDRLDDLSRKLERAMNAPVAPSAQMDSESLENVVNILADRFAAAQDPKAEHGAVEALQGQIAELARRLERSDAGFSALSSLQNSVSDLFAHLEDTRHAASETARDAAREAIRELMEQPERLVKLLPNESGVTREIADLRVVQDEADRRTHSTLNAVHSTLEKIVDRLAMLEQEIGDAQEASAAGMRLAEQSAAFTRARDGSIHAVSVPAEMQAVSQKGRLGSNAPADFLIEPGTLFPKSKEASTGEDTASAPGERSAAEPGRSRADFIAAARRAAQAAKADQGQRELPARPRIPMAAEVRDEEPRVSLVAQTRDFLFSHKRQLTLSVAALFLVVGAYAIVRTMNHTAGDATSNAQSPAVHSMNDTQMERKAESRASAAIDAAPAQTPQVQPQQAQPQSDKSPPRSGDTSSKTDAPSVRSDLGVAPNLPMMAMGNPPSQKAIAGSDPVVTGSIVGPKTANAPASESPAATAALRAQADAGNANAQYELATRYAEGRLMPRDLKLAAEWYEKASAHGVVPATYRLGSLYEKGYGVTRDFARAKALYQKAAEQGHSHAMHNLAVLIAEGGDGKPDYATAAVWFRKAAEFGIRDSQYNLAILYARGLGVSQDLVQSYMWFSVAAAQGDEDAGKKREDVAAKLDAKSLAQAKAAVDAFHAREPDRAANEVQPPPGGWEATVPVPVAPKSSSSSKAKISRL